MHLAFADCIASAKHEVVTEMADTPAKVLQAKRLRYRVYCEERGFEAGRNGIEEDVFDSDARHVLVLSRATREVLGTVRVAAARFADGKISFPIENVCPGNPLASVPRCTTGEVSRFALLRDRSGISPAAAPLMRLCLIQGVIQICGEDRLTHLCALMERTLLRLLRMSAIHFSAVGPAIEHRGWRQPSVWNIGEGLRQAYDENPAVWSFITRDGLLWPHGAAPRQRARLAA